MRMLVLALAVAAVPLGAAADDIYLTSGGQVSGRIVERTATAIAIDIGAGRITVPTSSVVKVVEGKSPLHEYEERAGRIPASDVEGWLALGEWASAQGLGSQAKEAYNRALAVAPGDPRANAALGRTQVDGRWLSEDESYQARGYVRFGGEWMTPAEHEAILRERQVESQIEQQRQQADMAAREAEARAAEADARARQAEAEAEEAASAANGIPLWYGWGAGPTVWPSGPIINYPTTPVRGRVR
jgi:tetratricopeptide repeat protein